MIRSLFLATAAALALAVGAGPAAGQGLAGSWLFDVRLDAGSGQATFEFQVEGTRITGTYGGILGEQAVTGTIEGNVVKFGFESPDAGSVRFDGVLDGDTLEGTCEYGALGVGAFTGKKQA